MIEVLFSMWLWKKLDERAKTHGLCNAVLWGCCFGVVSSCATSHDSDSFENRDSIRNRHSPIRYFENIFRK